MSTTREAQSLTRRRFITVGGLLLLAAPVLAACASTPPSSPTAAAAPTAAPTTATTGAAAAPATTAANAATSVVPAASPAASQSLKGELSVHWWGGEPKPGTFDEWGFIAQNYKKVRPDINLKVIRIPWESTSQWIQTQLAASTVPDVLIWYLMPTTQQEATHTSPWLAFDDYLKDRSTYTKQPWIEDIDTGLAKIYYGALRFQYGIPISYGASGWVYNKDIFTQLGVSEPKTWADLIAVAKKAKSNKITAIANAIVVDRQGGAMDWPRRVLGDVVAYQPWELITSGKVGEYKPGVYPNSDDIWQAFSDNTASYRRPEAQQMWNMLHEFVTYYPEGNIGWTYDQQLPYFLQGKAAMHHAWVSELRQIDQAQKEGTFKFQYGTFSWPSVTKESNPFPMDLSVPVDGGYNGTWAVPADRSKDQAKLGLILDYLQWWTSPGWSATYANTVYSVPANVHAQANPKTAPFLHGDRHQRRMDSFFFPTNTKIKWFNYFQSWILGQMDYNQYAKSVDDANRQEAISQAQKASITLKDKSPWAKPANYFCCGL